MRSALVVIVIAVAVAVAGCAPVTSGPSSSVAVLSPEPARFAGSSVAPAGDAAARDRAVIATAAGDLGCDSLRIVSGIDGGRALNGTYLRYVVEGCGQRALYLERCAFPPGQVSVVAVDTASIACEYLLVSTMPLGARHAPAAPLLAPGSR